MNEDNIKVEIGHLQAVYGKGNVKRTGSSYTVDPPVMDTDIDFICLIEKEKMWMDVEFLGYEFTGHQYGNVGDKSDMFFTYRKGPFNVIETEDPKFFKKFLIATAYCKRHNVQPKECRVILFETIFKHLDRKWNRVKQIEWV